MIANVSPVVWALATIDNVNYDEWYSLFIILWFSMQASHDITMYDV